jgi:hypothetical protein
MRRRLFLGGAVAAAATVTVAVLAGTAGTAQPPGFDTARPAMLAPLEAGVVIDPIVSTGDVIGEYQMSGIPDGLGAYRSGRGELTVMMNHELEPLAAPNVFSRISKFSIDRKSRSVLSASYPFTGAEGFARFCSSTLEIINGIPLYLTGEEEIPTNPGRDGSSIVMNAETGDWVETPHFGHILHENIVPVKRLSRAFFLTTDDDFREASAESPEIAAYLYAYIARTWNGAIRGTQGSLYVWKADEGDSPNDIAKGETLEGRFVPITQAENADGPTLERASHAKGGFKFVRLEDAAVAKSGRGHVYFADTGRLNVGPVASEDVRGRLYRLDIDPEHPRRASLTVVLDGNAGDDIVNPDNIDTSRRSVVIQEDRNSEHRGAEVAGGFGRIIVYNIRTGSLRHVAYAATPSTLRPGTWESSGVLNAQRLLGDDWWLVDVQAHSTTMAQPGADLEPNSSTGEDGQLLAIKIPRT